MADALLRVDNLTKRFGGLLAVNAASMSAEEGRITALIGPNGAGKTTLFAIASGFLRPSSGQIFFRGENVTGREPHLLARQGMVRTFQIVQPFAGLTVRENIAVGAHLHLAGRAEALAAAEDIAAMLGLAPMLDQGAGNLTVAGRKRLEIARALAARPKLLLLDEVLAGLTPSEIRDFLPVIRAICGNGVTILMIEHVMQAVMNLAEQIYVLAEGAIIAQGSPATVATHPKVIEAYLGHDAAKRLGGAFNVH